MRERPSAPISRTASSRSRSTRAARVQHDHARSSATSSRPRSTTATPTRDAHVILLRAEGRAFCAGYGLDWSTAAQAAERRGAQRRVWDSVADLRMMGRFVDTYMKLWYAQKPTIAAVQGWCIGGGTDMVLCADLIVAGEGARFGYPPSRVWGTPTTAMWVYRMGLEQAKRYLLTGDEIPAPQGRRDRADPRDRARRRARSEHALALARAHGAGADQPARHAEAALQPDRREHGPRLEPHARHALRRHRAPHAGGPRLRRARAATSASARRCASATTRSATTAAARRADLPASRRVLHGRGHAVRPAAAPRCSWCASCLAPAARAADDAVPPSRRPHRPRHLPARARQQARHLVHRAPHDLDRPGRQRADADLLVALQGPAHARRGARRHGDLEDGDEVHRRPSTSATPPTCSSRRRAARTTATTTRARARACRASARPRSPIFGSDFSLDDLAVVRHIDDATYQRLPDEVVQGKTGLGRRRAPQAREQARLRAQHALRRQGPERAAAHAALGRGRRRGEGARHPERARSSSSRASGFRWKPPCTTCPRRRSPCCTSTG